MSSADDLVRIALPVHGGDRVWLGSIEPMRPVGGRFRGLRSALRTDPQEATLFLRADAQRLTRQDPLKLRYELIKAGNDFVDPDEWYYHEEFGGFSIVQLGRHYMLVCEDDCPRLHAWQLREALADGTRAVFRWRIPNWHEPPLDEAEERIRADLLGRPQPAAH